MSDTDDAIVDYTRLQVELGATRGESPQAVVERVRLELETQSRHRNEASRALLSREMLSEEQAETVLGACVLARLRSQSRLVALPTSDGYRYPKFQFDLQHNDIYEVVGNVNELLEAGHDPFGAASWWLYSNEFVDGCPADLVENARSVRIGGTESKPIEDVHVVAYRGLIAAAKAVTDPVG